MTEADLLLPRQRPIAERLLPLTIAALGLAAAWGTQHYLAVYLTFWPALLAAGAIELAYICLALMRAGVEIQAELRSTTLALVWASVAFNFGHAYTVSVPGGLSPSTARFEFLSVLQAAAIAGFVPWIAYRLSRVQGGLSVLDAERSAAADATERAAEQARADLQAVSADRERKAAEIERLTAALNAAEQERDTAARTLAEAQAEVARRPARRGALPAARPVQRPALVQGPSPGQETL